MADITPESKTVNRADLLILLEDGPHGANRLATWLKQPSARVLWELKRMAREGLVRRVGADKRWVLAGAPDVPVVPRAEQAEDVDLLADDRLEDASAPDADEIDALLEAPPRRAGRPKLRKDETPAPSSREPGWWVKHAAPTDTARAGFIAESRHEFETRMSRAHVPAKLFPNQMGGFS